MDSISFNESFLLNLQLDQFRQQFTNSCNRVNILTNYLKPSELWLSDTLRGKFRGKNTGFKLNRKYRMQWCLKLDRNDIRFCVDFSSDFDSALKNHFDIVEFDKEVIVGHSKENSTGILPVYKDIDLVCEDISIFEGGQHRRTMADELGFLTFNSLAQGANWVLNITPAPQPAPSQVLGGNNSPVHYSNHQGQSNRSSHRLSPVHSESQSSTGHRNVRRLSPALANDHGSGRGSGQGATGFIDLFQKPPPSAAAAGPRSTPDLHEAVQKTIWKHTQQQSLPCDVSRPPPFPRVVQPSRTAVQARQAGESGGLASQPAGQVEIVRGTTAVKAHKKVIVPTDSSSCSEISLAPKSKQKKKKSSQVKTSTPKKRQMLNAEEQEVEHVYDSISSESDSEKMAREANLFMEAALTGRPQDPLTDFLKQTVPKFFKYLRIKEKGSNSSGATQQDLAAEFNAELDQIYNHTKQIIVEENKSHTDIIDANLPSIFVETGMETVVQPKQSEQNIKNSEINKNEIVTRSKSKTDVVAEVVNSSDTD